MVIIAELLDPKNDYVFKRIFGHIGNEGITANLVSAILKKKITNLELDKKTILDKDFSDDKIGILDIRATIDDKINCNIEMQVTDYKDIEKRILFYWSKMYSQSIKSGEQYNELEKNIVILITDYEIETLKEIPKYITKWNIREEEYSKIILTDTLEICIIELAKFNKDVKKENNIDLNRWIEFIRNPGGIGMDEKNKAIKEAKEVLEEISQDEHERYLAELREKYIRDQNAAANMYGDGLKKGRQEGSKSKAQDIARKLKEENVDINIISKTTGLSIEEIQKL